MKNVMLLFLFTAICIMLIACRKHRYEKQFCDCAESPKTVLIDTVDLSVYNVITPNGDGKNDVWMIDNIHNFPGSKVEIYRNGIKKFETTDYPSNVWGSEAKDGKYKYVIEVGGKTVTGYLCSIDWKNFTDRFDYFDFECLKDCAAADAGDVVLNP